MTSALYTVQRTDELEGLLGIARRLYGDPRRWPELYEANRHVIGTNPSAVRAGQQLLIPGLSGDATSVGRIYLVDVGDVADGLEGIARRLWGQPERWRDLYAVNRGAIGDDPRVIQPGQALIVP